MRTICDVFVLFLLTIIVAAIPVGGSVYGYSNAGIASDDVMCNGFESSVEACSRSPFDSFTTSQCQDPTTSSAGVVCTGLGTELANYYKNDFSKIDELSIIFLSN